MLQGTWHEPICIWLDKLGLEWNLFKAICLKYMNTDISGQMMFVSGETAEPSLETTTLIEEIVRQQVVEMVS